MTSTPVSRRTLLTAALAALNPLSSWQQSAQAASRFDRVVLDPGHGGKDPGSKWYGITEKSLTLDLAKRTQSILKAKGVPVTFVAEAQVLRA